MGMSELPKGWSEISLDKVLLSYESGSRPKGGVRGIPDGVPSIGGEHLTYSGGFNFSNIKYVPLEFANHMSKGKIQLHDILIVKDGATTGKTAFVDKDFPFDFAFVNEHVFVCRVNEKHDVKYIFHYLFSYEGQQRILENFQGSAQGGINKSFASGTSIPLPPTLEEQKRIVERLDLLLGKISKTKKQLDKIPAILKQFRQSVLSSACSGRLTADWRDEHECRNSQELIKEISIKRLNSYKKIKSIDIGIDYIKKIECELPDNWCWTALSNYSTCSRGRFSIRPRNDPRYFNGKYPFIQIGNLPKEGGYVNNHTQTLNEMGLGVSKMFSKGTVVIAIVGATIANTGILSYDMCFPDSLVGIETGTEAGNKYVEYYLRSVKEDIRQVSYAGGGQPNIKLETLEPYPIPLPPIPEQEEIVRRIDQLFTWVDKIEQRYKNAKDLLARGEKVIYAKAFRGELVMQEE